MAMKVKYQDGGSPVRWYRGRIQKIEESNEQAMQAAMDTGAQVMKDLIETRGTGRTWSRTWYGKSGNPRTGSYPGRVDSGDMLNAVDSWVGTGQSGRTQGRFGWINNREDYFRFQEGGFKHNITSENVEGMYAVLDAYEAAMVVYKEELNRGIRGA